MIWAVLGLSACARDEAPPLWLEGSWAAEVSGGFLIENWEASSEGRMLRKTAFSVENGDTLYSELARIDTLAGRVFLMVWPADADPLVLEMIEESPRRMTFENRRLQNPFRIRYELIEADHFIRTVTGIENGDTVDTRHHFERKDGERKAP